MFCIICDSQRLMAKFEELFVYLTNTAKQRFLIAGTTSLWRNSIIAINLWNQRQIYKVWINSSGRIADNILLLLEYCYNAVLLSEYLRTVPRQDSN